MNVTTLIADDEALARRRLRDLAAPISWLEVVAETADGEATIEAIDQLRPDLVFLDVLMPGASGLEVLARSKHRPAVIFTTAFDRYAVAAFELQAIDYLLKPFAQARFEAAVDRARRALEEAQPTPPATERNEALRTSAALTRFFVRERGRIVPVAVAEIQRLEAQDDYVLVRLAQRSHLVHVPLGEFERRLDPGRFMRIHRRHLVNLEHVADVSTLGNGRLLVRMRDGSTVTASRTRSREIRRRIV